MSIGYFPYMVDATVTGTNPQSQSPLRPHNIRAIILGIIFITANIEKINREDLSLGIEAIVIVSFISIKKELTITLLVKDIK